MSPAARNLPDATVTNGKLPTLPPLDPERGLDAVHQIVHIEGPPLSPLPPPPLRTRTMAALRELQEQAEADPDGTVDVSVIIQTLRLLVDRVL